LSRISIGVSLKYTPLRQGGGDPHKSTGVARPVGAFITRSGGATEARRLPISGDHDGAGGCRSRFIRL